MSSQPSRLSSRHAGRVEANATAQHVSNLTWIMDPYVADTRPSPNVNLTENNGFTQFKLDAFKHYDPQSGRSHPSTSTETATATTTWKTTEFVFEIENEVQLFEPVSTRFGWSGTELRAEEGEDGIKLREDEEYGGERYNGISHPCPSDLPDSGSSMETSYWDFSFSSAGATSSHSPLVYVPAASSAWYPDDMQIVYGGEYLGYPEDWFN
jgi:hypothetical protein